MTQNIICIGGIHGVGKSTFCANALKGSKLQYLSASNIITSNSEIKETSKSVSDISLNQEKLISGLSQITNNETFYILDSHFTLLNNEMHIEEIPVLFFEKIKPLGIVVLFDNPEDIKQRWDNRDNIKTEIEFIKEFQEHELTFAEKIAELLNIEFLKIKVGEYDSTNIFHKFIKKIGYDQ